MNTSSTGLQQEIPGGPSRTLLLIMLAVLVPPVLAMVFVPIFAQVSKQGYPTGPLEGIDLTAFARRDERMMIGFALVLLAYVLTVSLYARSWRRRLAVFVSGVLSALVSFAAVVMTFLAG